MENEMRIRGLHPEDAATLEDQNISDLIIHFPEDRIRLADYGAVCWTRIEDALLIEAVMIAYPERGKGYGRAIITDLIESFYITTSHLQPQITKYLVNPYTQEAQRFFEKIGFVKCTPEWCERLSPKLDSLNTYLYEKK